MDNERQDTKKLVAEFVDRVAGELEEIEDVVLAKFKDVKGMDYDKPEHYSFKDIVKGIAFCDTWITSMSEYSRKTTDYLNAVGGTIDEIKVFKDFIENYIILNGNASTVAEKKSISKLELIDVVKLLNRAKQLDNTVKSLNKFVGNFVGKIERDLRDLYQRRKEWQSGLYTSGVSADMDDEDSEE